MYLGTFPPVFDPSYPPTSLPPLALAVLQSCSLWRWTIQTQPSPTFTNFYLITYLTYLPTTLPPYLHTSTYFSFLFSTPSHASSRRHSPKYVSFFAACLLACCPILSYPYPIFNQSDWLSVNLTPSIHLYPHGPATYCANSNHLVVPEVVRVFPRSSSHKLHLRDLFYTQNISTLLVLSQFIVHLVFFEPDQLVLGRPALQFSVASSTRARD
ncbi:hypothetical protein F5Y04DRAFT_108284 [Hypomontagnella monticulosa]|nr:hypothetical protein F5Y04DRAFT_108284 [Hypomontagnella monticulosa]